MSIKKLCLYLALIFLVAFAFVSCDENQQLIINPESPTPTIRGTVSIPERAGLSGSDFFIRIMEGEKAVYTGRVDSDGSFSVPGLSEEATYSILLTTEEPGDIKGSEKDISGAVTSGYGGWLSNVSATINEQAGVGSVKVKPLGTIKGVVTKDGAEDGYDTTVYIPGTSYLAMTDGQGNFSIFNVPQATYTLRYISNGYMAKMVNDVVLYSDSDTENPVTTVASQILIKNAGNLVGNITKTGSADHSNITVMLSDGENTYTGSTATDGSLMVTGIVPGTYIATISSSGFVTQTVEEIKIEAAKNTTLNPISLTANGGTIEGSVVMNDGGEKAGVLITAKSSDNKYSYTTSADANGEFTISNAYPGIYTLSFSKAGYATSSITDVASTAGQTCNVGNISLLSLYGSVSGKVVLSESADNSGVTVTLTYVADTTIAPATISGADGTYTLNNLTNAGQYTITFSKDGYVSDIGKVVSVTLGQNTTVEDVTLRSLTSKVLGKVTLEGTDDFTGISVLLKAADNSVQYDATTDQQGNYVMARVNPGEYTLAVSKAGFVSKTINDIIIESSTEKTLDSVTLAVGVRSLTGTITAELKTDYSGFLVTATNLSDDTKVYSAITNTAGAYTLAGMIPGEYSIVISHSGYRTLTLPTVSVIDGSTKALETFHIEINRGTISGVATLNGRTSSEGIKIELLRGNIVADTQYTDAAGEYLFFVPQGNYSGARMSFEDYRTETVSSSIALFSDNFISIDNVELQATANTVYGTVDVLTTDDESEVTISFDGIDEITALVTTNDGAFRFEHVPVGIYTMRFRRDNCSDIVVPINVIAANGISLGTVTITPNTATIKGKVNLTNGSSLSGVLVTVDMGATTATCYTDASGRYEVGGISVADVYTVTYSKAGWTSCAQQISPKLERLEIREMEEMTLVDTTAPVLNSVVINSGANTAADRNVTLHFTTTEQGSGVSKVMITYDNVFDRTVTRHDYMPNMDWELPSGNGEKTIFVKVVDAAGNESNIVTTTVTLTDQKKEVSGVLTGDDLHWTEELSPYLVTGNIMVENGKTLAIDPGVDVQFAGAYYIKVEGTISAIGTAEKTISFYGIDDGVGNWDGINATKSNASTIAFSNLIGMRSGIQGYVNIRNSTITESEYSLGCESFTSRFKGEIRDSSIRGKIKTDNALLSKCMIDTSESYFANTYILGSEITGDNLLATWSLFENTKISNMSVNTSSTGMKNVSLESSSVWFGNGGLFLSCDIEGCMFLSDSPEMYSNYEYRTDCFEPAIIRQSNIVDCSNIVVMSERTTIEELDFRSNFWGYDKTREIEEKGVDSNLSFIIDYYDDFNLTKAVLTQYKNDPIQNTGFLGDSYYQTTEESHLSYEIGDAGPAGGIVFYDKGCYSDGWRYLEAAPNDFGDGNTYPFGLYSMSDESTYLSIGTSTAIGAGKTNTFMLYTAMGEAAYSSYNYNGEKGAYAARICSEYEINGFEDWFLPSSDELNLMYENLYARGLGNMSGSLYYSSSSEFNGHPDLCWVQHFQDGTQGNGGRYLPCHVRPIRAF